MELLTVLFILILLIGLNYFSYKKGVSDNSKHLEKEIKKEVEQEKIKIEDGVDETYNTDMSNDDIDNWL